MGALTLRNKHGAGKSLRAHDHDKGDVMWQTGAASLVRRSHDPKIPISLVRDFQPLSAINQTNPSTQWRCGPIPVGFQLCNFTSVGNRYLDTVPPRQLAAVPPKVA